MMDEIFKSMLEATGGNEDIYNAMESNDLADVVRAATRALDKIKSIPMRLQQKKTAEESNRLRKQGNVHYVNAEYEEAILCYNKALAFAPKNSIEIKMAYGNISAVMLSIKAYRACQLNIEAGLEGNCPKFLRDKLNKRQNETMKYIDHEIRRDAAVRFNIFMRRYIEFDVKRNADIPCASEDVDVQDIDGSKKVVAARNIKSGTIVAMERAFVSTQHKATQYTICYYCHQICLFFVPCEGCCQALFCSKNCRSNCMEEYHRIECQIVDYMGSTYVETVNKLMVRAAIKMSLKLSWEELRVASLEMGEKRLKKSTVSEAFDVNNPVSMLSYNDRRTAAFYGKIFNGSIICAAVLDCLSRVSDYFPEDAEEREKAIDAVSRVMLHLYATFTNRVEILCSSYNIEQGTLVWGVHSNEGWFSFTSKLAHSCEPNLYVLGLNDQVALVALQPIKKGEELTISYIEHFYDTFIRDNTTESRTHIRQEMIFNAIHYLCECRVCVQDWDLTSFADGKLTKKQLKAYNKAMENQDISNHFKSVCAALDSLAGMVNTTQHREMFIQLRKILMFCQYIKSLNKNYHPYPLEIRYLI